MGDKSKEKIIHYCLWVVLIIYCLLLLRITFFKQVQLFHLSAAIGASDRIISVVPFASILEMIKTGTSFERIIENILGNIVLFIPLGMLLPTLTQKSGKGTLIFGICTSAFIEIAQFIFGLGSTDIDDLIMNTVGVLIGYQIYRFIKRLTKSNFVFLITTLTFLMLTGTVSMGILLVYNTDLLVLSPKKVITENEELVADFIKTRCYLTGKFVDFDNPVLTVEKSVSNANEKRENATIEMTNNSRIYICYEKTDYFFTSISAEYYQYEQIEYSDFISYKTKTFDKGNSILIWSSDGSHADCVIIFKYVE